MEDLNDCGIYDVTNDKYLFFGNYIGIIFWKCLSERVFQFGFRYFISDYTWSIQQGNEYASITSDGVLTLSEDIPEGYQLIIESTSVNDITKKAKIEIITDDYYVMKYNLCYNRTLEEHDSYMYPQYYNTICSVINLPLEDAKSITFGNILGNNFKLHIMNEDLKKADYWDPTANPRTVNLATGSKYVCSSFNESELDGCYIYDETNQKYIFKGNSVQDNL